MTSSSSSTSPATPSPVAPGRSGIALRILLCVALVLVSVTVAVRAAGAQVTGGSSTAAPAPGSGPCARVDVVLLVDQSASLTRTDPDDRRVAAAEVLVRSLADSARASGTTIDVTVAGFGSGVTELGSESLPEGTEAALTQVAAFADRTADANTDHVQALAYAADHFRAVTDLPVECKRLVWFTDGAYSIDDPAAPGIAGYTTSTDPAAIEAELAGQLCGPLPERSQLAAPLSEQVRAAGMVVQLVDLRSAEGETAADRAERAATSGPVDRLLGGDGSDPCRVPGGRVESSQASDLAGQFFDQGQVALGRHPVPCDALAAGAPAVLLQAATVRGSGPDQPVAIRSGGAELARGTGYVTWVAGSSGEPSPSPSGGAAAGAGATPTTVTGGSLDGAPVGACFVALSATIVPLGAQQIDPQASSTRLSWAVVPVGATAARASAATDTRLGPDVVALTAVADGAPLPLTWDEASRTWSGEVAGPRATPPVVTVRADAGAWGEVASTTADLQTGASAVAPLVTWSGRSRLEGTGTFQESVRLTPAPVASGHDPGGGMCLTLGAAATSSATVQLDVPQPRSCYPVGEAFEVPVTVVVQEDQNAEVALSIPYTVTHRPAVGGEERVVAAGEVDAPALVLAKPADSLVSALVAVAIVLVSTVVPLVGLIVLVNLQRRLPRPSRRRLAWVPLLVVDGAVRRPAGDRLEELDLRRVDGTHDHYALPYGLSLERPRTWNPFAPAVVEVHSQRGPVTVVPWMAPGAGRTVQVPAGFTFLVIIRSEPGADQADAVVIAPADATPDAVDAALADAIATTNETWRRVSSVLPEVVRA